ncbi:MAG: prepilin peptidase, partial [bacterium]
RSTCEHCHHQLGIFDLFPLLSFLMLRGRCRYCGHVLDRRLILDECVGLGTSLTAYVISHDCLSYVIYFAILLLCYVISMIDLLHMIIPDELIIALGVCAVVMIPMKGSLYLERTALSLVVILCYCIMNKWRPDSMGGGDLKLIIVFTWMTGIRMIYGMMFSCLTASVYACYVMHQDKRGWQDYIPFGPFLCLGFLPLIIRM